MGEKKLMKNMDSVDQPDCQLTGFLVFCQISDVFISFCLWLEPSSTARGTLMVSKSSAFISPSPSNSPVLLSHYFADWELSVMDHFLFWYSASYMLSIVYDGHDSESKQWLWRQAEYVLRHHHLVWLSANITLEAVCGAEHSFGRVNLILLLVLNRYRPSVESFGGIGVKNGCVGSVKYSVSKRPLQHQRI